MQFLKINNALISVYDKSNIIDFAKTLLSLNVKIFATEKTFNFLKNNNIDSINVNEIINFPPLFNGRIKSIHPSIVGGLLFMKDNEKHITEANLHNIIPIDLLYVDLYPFPEIIKMQSNENEIIENIDVGGITLLRAGAKNFKYVLVIPHKKYLNEIINLLISQNGIVTYEQRKYFATKTFEITSMYDLTIYSYFSNIPQFITNISPIQKLRYGENPHQQAWYIGNFDETLEKIHGKELSYNNILDIEAALSLIKEFNEPTFVIIKHNNPCAVASGNDDPLVLWEKTTRCDPISIFGGIIITNIPISLDLIKEINKLYFEILIAPNYEFDVKSFFENKPNRIVIRYKKLEKNNFNFRSCINGLLLQTENNILIDKEKLNIPTKNKELTNEEFEELLFAYKIVKHCKSNAIAITKNKQLIGVGFGQASRVDAVKIAIEKLKFFNFDSSGAVLASDGFFPFVDSIELAYNNNIKKIIQPGGSINDKSIINYCNYRDITLVMTNVRHFKH